MYTSMHMYSIFLLIVHLKGGHIYDEISSVVGSTGIYVQYVCMHR